MNIEDAGQFFAQMWWGDHMSGWGGGWMWLWGSIMMLTWVVIIAAAVWLVTRAMRSGTSRSRAEQLLDERLARGDLTTEQYRELKEELRR
jgi:putative membrane protein